MLLNTHLWSTFWVALTRMKNENLTSLKKRCAACDCWNGNAKAPRPHFSSRKGPVTLPKIRVNAWIPHKIWICVLVRRELDHFCWLTWWKITDELRTNYGKISHKSLTNHALQHIGTKRPQTGRMRGCAWRIRDGKPRIISALSLVNCVWIAHDSRMNCAKNAQEALKLRSFRAYKTDAAAVPWHSRFNSRRQHIVSSSSSSSPFSSVSGPPKILTISEY